MDFHKAFWVMAFAMSIGVSLSGLPVMAESPAYPQPVSPSSISPSTQVQPMREAATPVESPLGESSPEKPHPLSSAEAKQNTEEAKSHAQAVSAPKENAVHTATAAGWEFDLLKSLPIEVSGYEESSQLFPAEMTAAEQVVHILNNSRHLALHMEAMRRAYHQLPIQQQNRLVELLHERHREIQDDAMRFFDYGYAKLLYEDNQAGLYLLRKANDRLRTQFTSLAYAMAQAEVDLNQEAAKPDVLTTRKMDVKYKLSDAVTLDAQAHLPGFWPTFVQVIERISSLPAYEDFTRRDFTLAYVPYGERVFPASESMAGAQFSGAEPEACSAPEDCVLKTPAEPDWGKLYRSMSVDLNDDGEEEAVHFFQEGEQNFRVLAINQKNQVLADLVSPVAPHILEDLDEDGIPEVVVRNYSKNPNDPLRVYRFNDCRFILDETVDDYFK